jgi:hypothetical protein
LTLALELTQPLTEIFPGGVRTAGACTTFMCRLS